MRLTDYCKEEGGKTLVFILGLLSAIFFLGSTTVLVRAKDTLQTENNPGNFLKAFHAAQAGISEARLRLEGNSSLPVRDSCPDASQWTVYIGDPFKAAEKGFRQADSFHTRLDSLQSDQYYLVKITHLADASGTVLYWGDIDGDGQKERNSIEGESIYKITSYGFCKGIQKTVSIEMIPGSFLKRPELFYVRSFPCSKSNVT